MGSAACLYSVDPGRAFGTGGVGVITTDSQGALPNGVKASEPPSKIYIYVCQASASVVTIKRKKGTQATGAAETLGTLVANTPQIFTFWLGADEAVDVFLSLSGAILAFYLIESKGDV